jgi:hypothetical protein
MDTFDVTQPLEIKRGRGRPPISDGRSWDYISLEEKIERVDRARLVLKRMSKHAIEKHFDMSIWGNQTPCGTVGCAAGQCGLDPWFNRRGFRMHFNRYGSQLWSTHPSRFFGDFLYESVFVNDKIMNYDKPNGEYAVTRKRSAQHRLALRGINQYLKTLKAQR